MHDVAVRIGDADWREWLLAVADTRGLRWLELPAALLEPEATDTLRLIEHLGLSVLHVPDAVPAAVSRYASESGLASNGAALAALVSAVRSRVAGRARYTSLDMGLDRLRAEGLDEGLPRRAHFLRVLAEGLEESGVTLGVRVRLPRPFCGSHAWEWAANLLHELAGTSVGLVLDVAMSDLPDGFDVEAALRECAAHLVVVRLHFRWRWGESPPHVVWERWCGALRHHPGRLGVVFCPQAPALATASALFADIEGWSQPLSGEHRRIKAAAAAPPAPPQPARSPE